MPFLSKTKMAKIKTEENSQFFFYLKHSKTKWENDAKKIHQYTRDVLTSTVFFFRNAWFAIDLGVWFIPSCYTLRHARGYGRWVVNLQAFTSKLEQILIKNSPSYILNRSGTTDLLVASPDALPLNYRRLTGRSRGHLTKFVWPKVILLSLKTGVSIGGVFSQSGNDEFQS